MTFKGYFTIRTLLVIAALLGFTVTSPLSAEDRPTAPSWSFAIHGGAGTLERSRMSAQQQADYRAALQTALDAGAKVLKDGGGALDAVTAAITILEDDPKFNAGRGAVFTWDGINELDSAIMDGNGRRAGAIAGVHTVRHPILLAQKVMDDGRHVFLSGTGAEQFAGEHGLEIVPPEFFATPERKAQLEKLKAENLSALDVEFKYGTVGAVARDNAGHLAAGTSTGGMTGKRWGRIGDSPIIGAGTYADDRSCAVSATGSGEYFIRASVAHAICDRVLLAGEDVETAARTVMADVGALGGDGGVIVVGREGDPAFSLNTPGMYRGRATGGGINEVAIFADE